MRAQTCQPLFIERNSSVGEDSDTAFIFASILFSFFVIFIQWKASVVGRKTEVSA